MISSPQLTGVLSLIVFTHVLDSTFHSLIVSSIDEDANNFPSEEKQHDVTFFSFCLNASYSTHQRTSSMCPSNVWTHCPVETFQSFTVLSKDDVAINSPSGENTQQ